MAERLHLTTSELNPVLITGPVAFDSIITPTQSVDRMLGGSASYAALAASYFTDVRLSGVVGDDFDKHYTERFVKRNIDMTGLEWVPGNTFFWKGKYFEDFNKRETLQLELGVFENFKPKFPPGYSQTPYVFIGSTDPDVQLSIIQSLEGDPYIVIDTIDFWVRKKPERFMEVLKHVDLLLMNDAEGCLLAQEANLISAGHKLRDMGLTVAFKKGEHGAMLFHEDGIFSMPPYPVTAMKDPTGAGDSYAGALSGYIAAVGKTDFFNLKHAMVYATAVASLTIEDFSCDRIEKAGPKAIEERYEALIQMMTF